MKDGAINPFDINDRKFIMDRLLEYYPDLHEKLLKLYDECWNNFHNNHPEFTQPPVIPVSVQDCWGALMKENDDSTDWVLTLSSKLIIDKDDQFIKDVIYHELCHLIYHDNTEDNAYGHPREFYDELEKYDSVFIQQNNDRRTDASMRFDALEDELD